ncbi:MAG: hypothetical protein AAF490_01910 [Chloroflexota bacterium]
MNDENKKPDPLSAQFLIAEFQETNQEYRRRKEEGLSRLNFFIALTTTVWGGVIALNEFSSIDILTWQAISIGALIFLLAVGWEFHHYSIKRGISTDEIVRAMARIRRYFVDHDPSILPYLTWKTDDEPTILLLANRSKIRRTTAMIESLNAGILLWFILNLIQANWLVRIIVAILGYFVVFQVLKAFAQHEYEKANLEVEEKSILFPYKASSP